jgi:phytoene dehydrogenase-like protein
VLPRDARTLLGTRLFRVRDRAEVANRMMNLRSGDPERLRGRTVERYLQEELAFDVSREYITAIIRLATYAHAPHLVDIADAAVQMRCGFSGVTYMDGGWQTLVNGLESAAGAGGVEILTGAPAARVEPGPGGAVILRDGRRLPADAIVLAVPPAVAAELLPVAATRQWADAAIPSRTACLDVTLRGLPRPRRLFGLGVDAPLYLSVHTNFAKLAPAGLATITAARYLSPGEQPGADALLRQLEGLLDAVQPGWRSREVHRQFLPSMTAATAMPLASAGGIPGRPGPAVPGADGVFVAGDWVGPTGWLADAALGSARLAARQASRWLSTAPRREPVLAGD